MDLLSLLFVAVGLSMDCVAVALSSGLGSRGFDGRQALTMGVFFGGFQALMPVIGWLLGSSIAGLISAFDHWVAFGLLLVIGLKMIFEALRDPDGGTGGKPLGLIPLTMMSVATSIDALAVGLSYSLLGVSILLPAVIIGVVCFSLSSLGAMASGRVSTASGRWARLLGGLILILIGIRILVEHVFG